MKNAARVHFVGIGGISMSSLAAITKNMGYNVSGSDRTESEITDRLASEGIDVKYFHAAENVNGASLVVYTAAVRKDNPELAEELEAKIKAKLFHKDDADDSAEPTDAPAAE